MNPDSKRKVKLGQVVMLCNGYYRTPKVLTAKLLEFVQKCPTWKWRPLTRRERGDA